jgi:hypothetical protein
MQFQLAEPTLLEELIASFDPFDFQMQVFHLK